MLKIQEKDVLQSGRNGLKGLDKKWNRIFFFKSTSQNRKPQLPTAASKFIYEIKLKYLVADIV